MLWSLLENKGKKRDSEDSELVDRLKPVIFSAILSLQKMGFTYLKELENEHGQIVMIHTALPSP